MFICECIGCVCVCECDVPRCVHKQRTEEDARCLLLSALYFLKTRSLNELEACTLSYTAQEFPWKFAFPYLQILGIEAHAAVPCFYMIVRVSNSSPHTGTRVLFPTDQSPQLEDQMLVNDELKFKSLYL